MSLVAGQSRGVPNLVEFLGPQGLEGVGGADAAFWDTGWGWDYGS